jgi:hypothetical protein
MKKKVVTLPLPPKPSVPSKASAEPASLQEIQAPALPKTSVPVLGALGSRMLGSEGVKLTVIQPNENAFSSYMDRYKVHTFTPTTMLDFSFRSLLYPPFIFLPLSSNLLMPAGDDGVQYSS